MYLGFVTRLVDSIHSYMFEPEYPTLVLSRSVARKSLWLVDWLLFESLGFLVWKTTILVPVLRSSSSLCN